MFEVWEVSSLAETIILILRVGKTLSLKRLRSKS